MYLLLKILLKYSDVFGHFSQIYPITETEMGDFQKNEDFSFSENNLNIK